MKEKLFKEQFMALVAAFLQGPDPEFVKAKEHVYWSVLKEIPDQMFLSGVAKCLRDSKFFPTIHELGEGSVPGQAIELAAYNPYVYSEPRKLTWEERLKKARQPKEIERAKKVLSRLSQ